MCMGAVSFPFDSHSFTLSSFQSSSVNRFTSDFEIGDMIAATLEVMTTRLTFGLEVSVGGLKRGRGLAWPSGST